MAFGRSNSLSLNTGGTNSLLSHTRIPRQHAAAEQVSLASDGKMPQFTPATFIPNSSTTTNTPANANAVATTTTNGGSTKRKADQLQDVHPSCRNLLTGTPSSSGQQPPAQQNNPPSQAGSLFGGPAAAASSQPGQTGGLFGNTQTNTQPTAGGGLFGGGNTQQQQQTTGGGLFGSTNTQQQGGGLFGNTQSQPLQQQTGGSLFGNIATQQQQPQQQTSNLFGSSTMAPNNATTTGGGGLFSSLNQSSQPQNTTSIFGNPASTSLFGPKPPDNTSMTGNMFHNSQYAQTRPASTSIFGQSATNPAVLNASLLGVNQFNSSQAPAFAGKLSMGQPNTTAAAAAQTVGAVQVHQNDLRGTTRFQDCADEVKKQFETVDEMIRNQEGFCRQIQAILGKHEQDIISLPPDVELVKEKADGVEVVLASDAMAVEAARKRAEVDRKDFTRCQRIAENQLLPATGYQLPGVAGAYPSLTTRNLPSIMGAPPADADEYDTDLITHYFLPLASSLQQTLGAYSSNLAEIEGHMRVIENSAVAQAQQLAARRAGVSSGGGGGGDETVRELADTLRGFEQSILGVAGTVGECREGVTGLVLGRLGEAIEQGGAGRGRRPQW